MKLKLKIIIDLVDTNNRNVLKKRMEDLINSLAAKPNSFIGFHINNQCRKLLEKTSYEIGKQLEPIVETSSIKSILDLVRSSVGRSVVSRTLYEFYDTEDLSFQKNRKTIFNKSSLSRDEKELFY